jgi:hypothetical protein
MKIEITAYGLTYNLHCPRCGKSEWSDEVYDSGANDYRKCMHCGADVCTDTHTKIGIVIEPRFYEFTPQTYYDITDDLKSSSYWRVPL